MFNPFFARPIGSDRFERHLLTQMILAEEKKIMEREAVPEVRLMLHATYGMAVKNDPVDDGYRALMVAIFARALVDYLESYASKLKFHDDNDPDEWVYFSRCVDMENRFFRTDPEKELIFDYVLEHVVHNEDDFYIQDRIRRIHEFAHKIECAI